MAARSKAKFWGRSLDEIVASIPTGSMGVYLLWVLWFVRLRSLRWVDHSPRGVLLTVVCLSVMVDNEEAVARVYKMMLSLSHRMTERHWIRNGKGVKESGRGLITGFKIGGAQISQKFTVISKLQAPEGVWKRFHTEDQKILGAILRKFSGQGDFSSEMCTVLSAVHFRVPLGMCTVFCTCVTDS